MSGSPKAAKKTAKTVEHPTYGEMVSQAITQLKDRKGSSKAAILKYIQSNFKGVPEDCNHYVKNALKKGVTSGALKQVKGTGASGSFKVGEKVKAPKKPKTTTTKKSPKKAAAKKPTVKKVKGKTTPKKVKKAPAAKKSTPKKKPAAKKPTKKVAKKAVKKTPKKTGAKKAAKK